MQDTKDEKDDRVYVYVSISDQGVEEKSEEWESGSMTKSISTQPTLAFFQMYDDQFVDEGSLEWNPVFDDKMKIARMFQQQTVQTCMAVCACCSWSFRRSLVIFA